MEVINKQKYEEAADLRDMERKILHELEKEKENFEKNRNLFKKEVTEDVVYDVVSLMTKIPIHKITTDETEKLINLNDNLSTKIVGQNEAVAKISRAIQRNKVGLNLGLIHLIIRFYTKIEIGMKPKILQMPCYNICNPKGAVEFWILAVVKAVLLYSLLKKVLR
jgi:hypothetical protein